MKPHFGQSDAAMNKLAGCNQLPNNNKPPDLLRLSGYTKAEHEEAAGMGLEDAFMKQPPCSCVPCKHYESSLDEVPCKYCRDHAKFEEKDFDPVKERDAAYDLGYKDAQKTQGYYGHHNGCDCAVCEDMHNTELRRKIADAEWNKLLDDIKRLTVLLEAEQKNVVYAQQKWAEAEERVEKWKAWYESVSGDAAKYRNSLQQIANQPLEPAHIYEIADRIKLTAKAALEI